MSGQYKQSYAAQAYKVCLMMKATDADLAEFFEVCEKTINNWKKKFPEFLQSIKKGKSEADMHIAEKLLNRAEGATWIEEMPFKVKTTKYNKDGKKISETEEVVVVPVQKAAPPDTTAIIFWLKNRQPKSWRDKIDHELSGKDGGAIDTHYTVTILDAKSGDN